MDCSTMQSGALSLHLWGCEEDGSGLSSQGFHQALSKLKFKKNDNIRERKKKGKKKQQKEDQPAPLQDYDSTSQCHKKEIRKKIRSL